MSLFRLHPARITRNFLLIIFCMLCLGAAALLLGLNAGHMDSSLSDILHALLGREPALLDRVILELRLPRVMNGFLVGGMLGLAGVLMQVLLRNPLAEPYILGVSGGAGAFAVLALLAGLTGLWINLSAFGGALLSMLLVFVLSRLGGDWNPLRILLTGVVIAAGWSAVISLLLVLSPAGKLHGMLFWLMGDLGYAGYGLGLGWILLLILGACLLLARDLNLLARGELPAAALGAPVTAIRYFIYFAASLLAALAVTQAGGIGFIGLIVPHMGRLLFGGDHRILLPVSVLLGGSMLVLADALARTLAAPQQLPVGILTALLGVPLFLLLLRTSARGQRP